ncbi:putative 2OG-Fe(II) oxygenase [Candidatus Pelagibacter sp. HIMB1521]|uniref:putative 2OG-Fe(II) oxygenase n=1 Tax=Candidatus Pelagibacter sp. HIMB1521 TaxID=3413344 RepID=UPI003F87D34A
MRDIQANIIRPFGPSILKVTIPEKIVKDLNTYIDKIVENEKKSKELDFGKQLIGDVTQEFKLEKEFVNEIGWLQFLANCSAKWIEMETRKKIQNFNLLESWIVRQFKNEYNPAHYHNGHISGAGFLKLPKTFGKHVQNKDKEKDYFGGTLNLIHGSRAFISESIFTIKPKVGDFYFFPHYLMHTVYPFKETDEERRSISFNALIDREIFEKI